jgi:DNA-binding transcriptional ArsR family regulator
MLDELFGSRIRAKALAWLVTHPDERYFVRQLTSILGEDSTNLSRELARLERLGLLTCSQEGRQKYYQINSRSALYEDIRGLAVKTSGVADVLHRALSPLARRISAAFLIGSFAEGRENAQSDIDLVIIGSASLADISKVLGAAEEQLRREINPTVYPAAEFRSKLAAGHHFVTSVMKGKKVFLFGDKDELARVAKGRPSH